MKLNEDTVRRLPVPETGSRVHYFTGALLQGQRAPAGFGVRVTSKDVRSFVLNYRHRGIERRLTIGQWPTWSALQAVKEARQLRQRVDRGEDPSGGRRGGTAVNDVLDKFITDHVQARKQRTAAESVAIIDRIIRPAIGKIGIADIRRSDVMAMLDRVERERGASSADRTLGLIRKAFNWWSLRDDHFVSPIVRGMTRVTNGARDRVLEDDELRKIWRTAEGLGAFGALVRFLLLTATRRNEAGQLNRAEIVGDVWVIPAARYKTGTDHVVPLSAAAQAILEQQLSPYPFSVTGSTPLNNFTRDKNRIDEVSGVTGWRLHDLRRSARSLMSRAGIQPHIAEQALGHRIRGVAGVYDRHSYEPEKRRAFEALAALVAQIVGGGHG